MFQYSLYIEVGEVFVWLSSKLRNNIKVTTVYLPCPSIIDALGDMEVMISRTIPEPGRRHATSLTFDDSERFVIPARTSVNAFGGFHFQLSASALIALMFSG